MNVYLKCPYILVNHIFYFVLLLTIKLRKWGKISVVVSLFHLSCVLEGESYHIFSRTIQDKCYLIVSISAWKSPMWSEKRRGQAIHYMAQESSKGLGQLAVSYFACKGVLPEFMQAP